MRGEQQPAGGRRAVDEQLFTEMIMARGKGKDIRKPADMLSREKVVLYAKLTAGTTGMQSKA